MTLGEFYHKKKHHPFHVDICLCLDFCEALLELVVFNKLLKGFDLTIVVCELIAKSLLSTEAYIFSESFVNSAFCFDASFLL